MELAAHTMGLVAHTIGLAVFLEDGLVLEFLVMCQEVLPEDEWWHPQIMSAQEMSSFYPLCS
jgi:hypothetical protein